MAFSLIAQPHTDLWKAPPDTFRASMKLGKHHEVPLSKFRAVRATFEADWQELYDQGGILVRVRRPDESLDFTPSSKWVKFGVELLDGNPRASTVCCDNFADWSVAPLSFGEEGWVTVEVEREESGFWIRQVSSKGEKVPLREVTWLAAHTDSVLDIYPLAARPKGTLGGDALAVHFAKFEVEAA